MTHFYQRCRRQYLGGQESSHAGPTFPQSPKHTTATMSHIIPVYNPLPTPTTAPPLPPVNDKDKRQRRAAAYKPAPVTQVTTTAQEATSAPLNQTPYRLSFISKAKASAQNFLGKFFFGDSVLTQILLPVQKPKAMHREKLFDLTTGKIFCP